MHPQFVTHFSQKCKGKQKTCITQSEFPFSSNFCVLAGRILLLQVGVQLRHLDAKVLSIVETS